MVGRSTVASRPCCVLNKDVIVYGMCRTCRTHGGENHGLTTYHHTKLMVDTAGAVTGLRCYHYSGYVSGAEFTMEELVGCD